MTNKAPRAGNLADQLIAEAAEILGDYVRDGRTRTDLLKQLAPVVARLRETNFVEDGVPDWSGRTHAYRSQIREVYARAGVPSDRLDTVQTALRYHVGNYLRDNVDHEELAAAGLSGVSPKDRLQAHRDVVNAVAASVGGFARGDVARILAHAEALLEYADPSEASELDLDRIASAEVSLAKIKALTTSLARGVAKARRAAGRSDLAV